MPSLYYAAGDDHRVSLHVVDGDLPARHPSTTHHPTQQVRFIRRDCTLVDRLEEEDFPGRK